VTPAGSESAFLEWLPPALPLSVGYNRADVPRANGGERARGGLLPLPGQPDRVPWPTEDWPTGEPAAGVDRERLERSLERAFRAGAENAVGETHAVVVVHRGVLIAERYGQGIRPDQTLRSWSIAKSILHASIGILVRDGDLDVHAPAAVPEWSGPGDPRGRITVDQLLRMSSGLGYREDYDDELSDVRRMLFGDGREDMARYAASRPLAAEPDTEFRYTSGQSLILSRIVGDVVGGGADGCRAFMRRELFDPIGMTSASPRFDAAGTFIGSSYVFATARDFARFGLLYLRDGIWDGRRLLPEGWVDRARTPTPTAPLGDYGAHFWISPGELGTFSANGFEGQRILIVPALDLVVVRLGRTPAELVLGLQAWLAELLASFSSP
jgi:CubicO group peptidase (beta-lactamase class C family)